MNGQNGQGTYTFPDGREYVGSWKDGIRNGRGKETLPNGTMFVGEYKDGKPWNGKFYINGDIFGKMVNGRTKP